MQDPWAILLAAASDRRSGAAQIARSAAAALRALPGERVFEAVTILLSGHPSMAPMWRLASEALTASDPREGVRSFLHDLELDARASEVVAAILPESVLTISLSSSVARAIERRRPARTICMRSDPGGEGRGMAESISEWTRAEVLEDDRALSELPASAVVTGVDALTPESVVNKVKTRLLAEAAQRRGVPCYAVAGRTKLVDRPLPVVGPFEAVPLGLFTRVALPQGLVSPEEAAEAALAARVHPDLLPILAQLSPA